MGDQLPMNLIQSVSMAVMAGVGAHPQLVFSFFLVVLVWMGVFIGAYGFYVAQRAIRYFHDAQIQKDASQVDQNARLILEQMGFSIAKNIDKQIIRVYQDGNPLDVPIRPDMLVSKGGKSYVVDIKTKHQRPRLSYPETRRQLLEYYVTYKPDGVLLMDMENKRIHDVRFDLFTNGF